MAKNITFDTDSRAKLAKGVNTLADAVTVEDSQTFDITIDTVEGMQFDKGYVSAYFVTDNDRMEACFMIM